MGWTYRCDPSVGRDEIVKQLIAPGYWGSSFTVMRHSLVGNNLWMVVERVNPDGTTHRFISLDLLASGRPEMGWGYKDLCESMGLFEVDCPLGFFDLVPEPPGEHAEAWRERVRAYHRQQRVERAQRRALAVGDTITHGDDDYWLRRDLGRKGWYVERRRDGTFFRLPARLAMGAIRRRIKDTPPAADPVPESPVMLTTTPLSQQSSLPL